MMLEVPRMKQPPYGCGPTAMSMALAYYGSKHLPEEIIETLGGIKQITSIETNLGTTSTEVALFAQRNNHPVDCYTFNMRFLSGGISHFNSEELRDYIFEKYSEDSQLIESEADLTVLNSYLNLIDEGAQLSVRKPDFNLVRTYLDEKIPLLLNVHTKTFYKSDESYDVGHTLLLNGYDGNSLFYIDPQDGKQHEVDEDHLHFSTSVYSVNKSAYLIAVHPKKS